MFNLQFRIILLAVSKNNKSKMFLVTRYTRIKTRMVDASNQQLGAKVF